MSEIHSSEEAQSCLCLLGIWNRWCAEGLVSKPNMARLKVARPKGTTRSWHQVSCVKSAHRKVQLGGLDLHNQSEVNRQNVELKH